MSFASKIFLTIVAIGYALSGKEESPNCFTYRDDIGAFWVLLGYSRL